MFETGISTPEAVKEALAKLAELNTHLHLLAAEPANETAFNLAEGALNDISHLMDTVWANQNPDLATEFFGDE